MTLRSPGMEGKVLNMFVREVMTTEPVAVTASTTIKAALVLLNEHDITALPVVTSEGRICGVVSEADVIRELVPSEARLHMICDDEATAPPRPVSVGEVMSAHAVTVHPETDLAAAVELMTSTEIKSLPVVDQHNRLVGMLSRRDVVRVLALSDDVLEREVDALLVAVGIRDWLVDVRDGVTHVSGPSTAKDQRLARAVARAVPGVLEVHIEGPTRSLRPPRSIEQHADGGPDDAAAV